MIDEIQSHFNRMQVAKIQFGVTGAFTNDDGEIKEWTLYNKAVAFNDDFISDGVFKLKEKIENYSQLSSSWRLLRITEIQMTITKFRDIIHISGSALIKTPES